MVLVVAVPKGVSAFSGQQGPGIIDVLSHEVGTFSYQEKLFYSKC